MLPEWLRKLFGEEEEPRELIRPLAGEPREVLGAQQQEAQERVQAKAEEPKEGFLSSLFGSKTISKSFDREPEPLPDLVDPEAAAKFNEGVRPQSEDIGTRRVTSPDNPYAEWTKQQLKDDVRPDVRNYLESAWLPLTNKLGIPEELSASQWAIESGRQPKDNPVGLMRNNQLLDYGDLSDNARAYDETLRDIISTNMGMDEESFKYEDFDTQTLLHFMQFDREGRPGKKRYEAHMPNPQNYIDMINAMPEWRYYSRP
jgi:hypothetical protein